MLFVRAPLILPYDIFKCLVCFFIVFAEVYRTLTGQNEIPFMKHGYLSINHVIKDMPEVVSFKNQAGDTILRVKKNINENFEQKEQLKVRVNFGKFQNS